MNVLVTGASGFVGKNLAAELLMQGHRVTCLVRDLTSVDFKNSSVHVIEGNLHLPGSLKKVVLQQDYIFHVAGVVTAPNQATFDHHNVVGTQNLLQAIAGFSKNCQKFVYVSSLAAAGPSACSHESDLALPISFYGESKKRAEDCVHSFSDKVPAIIIRPPMVYGPWDKQFLVLMKMAKAGFSTVVSGEPRYYSTIYVKDLIRGLVLASQTSFTHTEVFYLTDPLTYSWGDILDTLEACLSKKSIRLTLPHVVMKAAALLHDATGKVLGKTFPYNSDKYKEAIAPNWVCSSDKARKLLNFSTHYSLREGMAETVAWYRSNAWL